MAARSKRSNPLRNNRVLSAESPFLAGKSMSPIHGIKNTYTNWRSYSTERTILSTLTTCRYRPTAPLLRLSVDTELLCMPLDAGCWKPIHTISGKIGKATNNVAELETIHKGIQWILHKMNKHAALTPDMNTRLFTDNQYARYVLLSTKPFLTHLHLVESIRVLTARLRYDNAAPVSIHCVPSHILQSGQHTAGDQFPATA